MVASSFAEVIAQCWPFPAKGVKVEEMIDLVDEEVQTVPNTIWQLNDIFGVLAIEGVLSMLNNVGCQELSNLREIAASSDVSIL
jgi:hypothetical protein